MDETTNVALSGAPMGTAEKGMRHKIAGLFAGIGGLERGLARGGHETIFLCENDQAATSVLSQKFDVRLHDDVRTLARLPRQVSLVAAGFPCQDLSQAGQTAGIGGARSGLVDHVIRLVEAQQTPWVLLENVPFMLQLSAGRAMSVIASAFERLGYRWAYRVVDSRAFGLPQRRRRVYFLASKVADPRQVLFADETDGEPARSNIHTAACGFYWTEGLRGLGWAFDAIPTIKGGSALGIPSPPAIILPDGTVGTPDLRDAERLQGFPSNWTKAAERTHRASVRWRLVGNAVSVPAAEWIGKRLSRPGEILDFACSPMVSDRSWPTAGWNVGAGRFQVAATEWPVRRKYQPLEDFLLYPLAPLSAKATSGFLGRAERSDLRFPSDFLNKLRKHLATMDKGSTIRRQAA